MAAEPAQTSSVILLHSTCMSDAIQEQNQRRAMDLLTAKGLAFEMIDGATEDQHARRNELFAVSEQRGKYPQIFIRDAEGTDTFVGLWDAVQELNEACDLPAEFLAEHPEIPTFDSVFAGCQRAASS